MYEVTNANIYNIMRDDIHEFDTFDYSADNPFDMLRVNKKIVGLMKDKCNGEIMLEFAGLRSKMYSIRLQNQKPIKKAKGVKTSIVKNTIIFDDYIKCLHENVTIRREQHNIRSRRHVLHTEREMKVALSARDDKRHLLSGQTDTMPWGHCMVGELEDDGVGEPQGVLEQHTPPWEHYVMGELSLLEDDAGVGGSQRALEPPPPPSQPALYEQQLQRQELITQQQSSSDQSLKQQAVKRIAISLDDDVQSKKLKT